MIYEMRIVSLTQNCKDDFLLKLTIGGYHLTRVQLTMEVVTDRIKGQCEDLVRGAGNHGVFVDPLNRCDVEV